MTRRRRSLFLHLILTIAMFAFLLGPTRGRADIVGSSSGPPQGPSTNPPAGGGGDGGGFPGGCIYIPWLGNICFV
jgi:hypothetical protein